MMSTLSTKNKQFLDVMEFRHACKQFNPEEIITPEDFNTILEAGRLSPSSFGFEPWKFLVIQDKALKQKLFPVSWGAQNSLNGASHFVIILARKSGDVIYSGDYISQMMTEVKKLPEAVAERMKAVYENFQRNEFNLLDNERALFDWACKQSYIALGNMLTAAAFLGIDSCPIEGFNPAAVESILQEEGILDPKHFGVSVMAGFGYRAKEPQPKTRRPMEEVVQWI